MNLRPFFLTTLLMPAFLSTGCRDQEPARSIPANWQTWRKEEVSLRIPPQFRVTTWNRDIDDMRLFIETNDDAHKQILCLEFGEVVPRTALQKTKSLGPSKATRIGPFDTDRLGPGFDESGAFSEGFMKLGGDGHFQHAHFWYSNLSRENQEMAETVIASIQKHT